MTSWVEKNWPQIIAMPAVNSRRKQCAVIACDRPSQALGLCTAHYNNARQHFDPDFRASYLAAKRERDRSRRQGERGVAGRASSAAPDTEQALP